MTRLQDRLYRLGWFNGVRDDDFGPATQTAVKKFAVGVKEDGIATPELQEMLFAEDAPRSDDKTAAPAATPSPQGDEQPRRLTIRQAAKWIDMRGRRDTLFPCAKRWERVLRRPRTQRGPALSSLAPPRPPAYRSTSRLLCRLRAPPASSRRAHTV